MKLNRLGLIQRLSHIEDEQAGKAVQRDRQALDRSLDTAKLIETYRQNLSISGRPGHHYDGQTLRSHAAFYVVADAANVEASRAVADAKVQLDGALGHWTKAREHSRTLDKKYRAVKKTMFREREIRQAC
jgi:hypothetical protein